MCKKEIGPKDYYRRFQSVIPSVEYDVFLCSSTCCYDKFHFRYMSIERDVDVDFNPLPEKIKSRFSRMK